jgi:hypothetical protein
MNCCPHEKAGMTMVPGELIIEIPLFTCNPFDIFLFLLFPLFSQRLVK